MAGTAEVTAQVHQVGHGFAMVAGAWRQLVELHKSLRKNQQARRQKVSNNNFNKEGSWSVWNISLARNAKVGHSHWEKYSFFVFLQRSEIQRCTKDVWIYQWVYSPPRRTQLTVQARRKHCVNTRHIHQNTSNASTEKNPSLMYYWTSKW